MIQKTIPFLLCAALLSACATNRAGRSQFNFMPDSEMNAMGIQAFEQLKQQKPVSGSPRYQKFVQCIARAITAETGGNWEVVVFEDKTLNAFALPGNKIGVHTGLIEFVDNADQLAAVIGHEVAHVLNKHGNERASQKAALNQGMSLIGALANPTSTTGQLAMGALGLGAQYGILMPYSRLHESEADIFGLNLMAKAGFKPGQSVVLWQKMDKASQGQTPPEFLSTHPSHQTRIADLQKALPKAKALQQQAHQMGKQPHCAK